MRMEAINYGICDFLAIFFFHVATISGSIISHSYNYACMQISAKTENVGSYSIPEDHLHLAELSV